MNYREERSSNTLYQELSFQESSVLEDSSEITGTNIRLTKLTIFDQCFRFSQVIGSIRASLRHQVKTTFYCFCTFKSQAFLMMIVTSHHSTICFVTVGGLEIVAGCISFIFHFSVSSVFFSIYILIGCTQIFFCCI